VPDKQTVGLAAVKTSPTRGARGVRCGKGKRPQPAGQDFGGIRCEAKVADQNVLRPYIAISPRRVTF